ncbi:unnamed protein product, partial [Prorocentrum cordatum]
MESDMDGRRLGGSQDHPVVWVIFLAYVGTLLALDVNYLQPPLSTSRISFNTAVKLTSFWLATGVFFNVFIMGYMGWEDGLTFLYGFCLEYMLSFDNLFVFHLVFAYYCTPEALLYRALYFGIAGAMLLRAFFLFVGYAFLVSGMYVFKLAFGALLIWSGIRSANDFDDEDTADPTNNRCIAWVAKNFPVSDSYEPHGRFFITVAEVDCPQASGDWADTEPGALQSELRMDSMEVAAAANLPRLESFEGSSLLDPHRGSGPSHSAGLPRE